MAEERSGVTGGIRTGIGILMAFKDAVEDTLDEALERGDLSRDRARAAVQEAAQRVQLSVGEVRERLDLVTRRELDELRQEVAALRERLDRLEGGKEAAQGADDRKGGERVGTADRAQSEAEGAEGASPSPRRPGFPVD